MTVEELIKKLQALDPKMKVCVNDSTYGFELAEDAVVQTKDAYNYGIPAPFVYIN